MALDFYSDAQLSERLAWSPEHFLIARDAIVSRCGPQTYTALEVPQVEADDNGLITVMREPSEVLSPASLSSFAGKPLVLDHPAAMVDGGNYRHLAVGHVLAARAGSDDEGPVVLADMIITDPEVAELVARGTHRGLSVGYSADYVPQGRGRAMQTDIVANHIAILRDGEQRCGPRCVIRDSRPRKDKAMRRSTRDQGVMGEQGAWARSPNFNVGMGDDPGGDVGPSIVARLAYPASALSIGTDGAGGAVVWFHGPVSGKLDIGVGTGGDGPLPDARARTFSDPERLRQRNNDAAWCRQTLAGINAANRAFWKGK